MSELRLYDDPGAEVAEITTTGTVFKPFLNAINYVADEVKLHIDTDGLSVTAVDPANVFLVNAEIHANAFDTDTIQNETTLGVPTSELKSLTRRARKGTTDELTLSLNERELTAAVARGYENHNVVSQGTMQLIDPDSIRGEPDLPDLDLPVDVRVDADPFTDALSYAVGVTDTVEVSVKGVNQHANALYLGGETDTRAESVAVDGIETSETAASLYSKDYLADILAAVNDVEADSVRLRLGDEFPAIFQMEHPTLPLSVEYMLSPRIQSA